MRKLSRGLDPRISSGQHLGRAIRGLRRERGLTLAALSEQSGLSVPFLSQLENNRAKPSLQSLSAIATALGCNMSDVISAAQADSVVDVGRSGGAAGDADRSLGTLGGQVHVTEVTRQAGAGEEWQSHIHEVVLYVVRGAVVVTIWADDGEVAHGLGVGDRILCGGGVAYRWQADVDGAVVIAVRVDDRAVLSRD
jgi:transcriptional regulator with XRE-family HTH domain